jgi:hypothetical protein
MRDGLADHGCLISLPVLELREPVLDDVNRVGFRLIILERLAGKEALAIG